MTNGIFNRNGCSEGPELAAAQARASCIAPGPRPSVRRVNPDRGAGPLRARDQAAGARPILPIWRLTGQRLRRHAVGVRSFCATVIRRLGCLRLASGTTAKTFTGRADGWGGSAQPRQSLAIGASGGGGIRTHDRGCPDAGFQDRCDFPGRGRGRSEAVGGRVGLRTVSWCPQGAPTATRPQSVGSNIWLNQAEDGKPSNGLEPLTPSLPWKCSTN